MARIMIDRGIWPGSAKACGEVFYSETHGRAGGIFPGPCSSHAIVAGMKLF